MPCHNAATASRGLDFETDWYKVWVDNQLVVPGDASASAVYIRMTTASRPMPPSGELGNDELAIIADWINAGAVCPDGPAKDSGLPQATPAW